MSESRDAVVGARLDRCRRALAHALLVTVLTTVVTGCAHSFAGGAAPTPILLAAAGLTTLLLLAPVLGAAATTPRRIVAVAVAQVVQHMLFSLPQPVASADEAGGHAHHAIAALPTTAVQAAAHEHGDMVLAHVVAGALTLVALVLGARIVAALLAVVLGDRIARLETLDAPLGTSRPAAIARERRAVLPASSELASPGVRRGPPLLHV